jgi:hypothetical protein
MTMEIYKLGYWSYGGVDDSMFFLHNKKQNFKQDAIEACKDAIKTSQKPLGACFEMAVENLKKKGYVPLVISSAHQFVPCAFVSEDSTDESLKTVISGVTADGDSKRLFDSLKIET